MADLPMTGLGTDEPPGRDLQHRPLQFFGRQAHQQGQAAMQAKQCLAESLFLLCIAA